LQNSQKIAWKRITAEATAIVVSILIAFGIDAWWQERGEKLALIENLEQFEREVIANDELIDEHLDENASDLMALQRVFLTLSDPGQETLPDSFKLDLGNSFWIRYPKTSMTAFDDLASSGRIRALTNRRLVKVINEYKNSAVGLDLQTGFISSSYYNIVQPAIGLNIALSDLGWDIYENYLGRNGENTGVTPQASFSTNSEGLKSLAVWNALFFWKTLKIDESRSLEQMKAQGLELRDLLREEIEDRSQ
jgi:hypothetical protein